MEKNNSELQDLLRRYIDGECTEAEKAYVETWYNRGRVDRSFPISEKELNEEQENILNALPGHPRKRSLYWIRYAAAILVILILTGAFILIQNLDQGASVFNQRKEYALIDKNINPGGDRATLTLADGTVIQLDEADTGIILRKTGQTVYKNSEEQIVYQDTKLEKETKPSTHVVSTPRGGQYKVTLPDGTKVWLNAASSIKYLTANSGESREVELKGEAYFEVAHDPARPFRVTTLQQTIEVLGTHFNINCYQDEPSIKTTLLEGSVKITEHRTKKSVLLEPGQQAILNKNHVLTVSDISVAGGIAWKEGFFRFEDADIESILRQFSRWYDVEVEFEGAKPSIKLSGEMHRDVNASQALEILTYFNLQYRIEPNDDVKKIIVYSQPNINLK